MITQKDIRDDMKLTLSLPETMGSGKLEVTLFSMVEKMVGNTKVVVKDRVWKATWDGEVGESMKMLADNKVLVTFDYAATVTNN